MPTHRTRQADLAGEISSIAPGETLFLGPRNLPTWRDGEGYRVGGIAGVLSCVEAARVLLANYRDVLGDDAEARADAVEGETSLREAITQGLARIVAIEALETGVSATMANLKARASRLEQQKEHLRTSLAVAMEIGAIKRHETALATITLKPVPAKVEITDDFVAPRPPKRGAHGAHGFAPGGQHFVPWVPGVEPRTRATSCGGTESPPR